MIEDIPDYPALQAIQNALWDVSEVRGAAVMVGSGFSMNAELPSPTSKAPPLWSQIASAMEEQLGSGSAGAQNPLRLAEEFRALLGQPALDGLIRDMVPDTQWLPGESHHRLLELPWSDILSTNWDTLLERGATEVTENSYDIVHTRGDIARTRSPRIIKLHGTLPSHTPFIVAEEDYRTYPVTHAPFVNLAQHILLENELLLLGFSGDDPNFLAWAGWVRDQLGASARKVRLAGVLNLSPARRRYLENLHVTPIDLASLVSDIADPAQRHAQGTKLLLDSLHAAKPKPSHVWNKNKRFEISSYQSQSPETRVSALVNHWADDRRSSPEWLVAPYYERYCVRQETAEITPRLLNDLAEIKPYLRCRFAAELSWRLEMSHLGVTARFNQVLTDALGEDETLLQADERKRILVLLCYAAIENRDTTAFDLHVKSLNCLGHEDNEAFAWAAYLKGLYARDWLHLASIPPLLETIAGNDPVWLLRRASLYCVICEPHIAAEIVRDALRNIRARRSLDRRSLWLLSREAWARFLWQSLSFELRNDKDHDFEKLHEWPSVYKLHDVDPWDQLNAIDHEFHEELERERKYSGEEKAHFEAGSWTPRAKDDARFVSPWIVSSEWLIRRLADTVGLPARAGSHNILETKLVRALETTHTNGDEALTRRSATYGWSHDGDLINRRFGRIQVAAMQVTVLNDLVAALRESIKYFVDRLSHPVNKNTRLIEKIRALTELLSRLAVRCEPAGASELVNLGIFITERVGTTHWWLYRPIGNLITRSLSALPPAERGKHAFQMLSFPLPFEIATNGPPREWPEFSDDFRGQDVLVVRPQGEWTKRIRELISSVVDGDSDTRHRAISRLWVLHLKHALTIRERQEFAEAIWSKRNSPSGLPTDYSFYPAVFIQLPEPEKGLASKAFHNEVVEPLLRGEFDSDGALESLAYIGSEADKGRAVRPFSESTAAQLIREILHSSTQKENEVSDALFYGLLPIARLDATIAETLWSRSAGDLSGASLRFIPFIVNFDPSYELTAIARLRRALNSREYAVVDSALAAVREWIRTLPSAGFPRALATAVASLVAIRRDPGLFRALDVSVELVQKNLMSPEEIDLLIDGMSELIIETDYQTWREGDFRTSTLTYIRANAYRLARALEHSGHRNTTVADWIREGSNDPVPEVRYVQEKHS